MRVVPHGVMALAAVERAALLQVAVGEQDGRCVRVGVDAHRVGGEHVGAVEEVGDAAEALRLALARVDVVAAIDALQRLVGIRVDEGGDLEREGLGRRLRQRQRGIGELVVLFAERSAVERDVGELELLAVEPELLAAACRLGIGPDGELGADARARRLEGDVEVHPVDQIGGRPVVLELDRPGSLELHRITVPLHPGAFGVQNQASAVSIMRWA